MFEHAKKTAPTLDRERVAALARPIVEAHGGELVDLEFKTEQGGWVLRVFVEKLGATAQRLSTKDAAVDLDLCANVARELSPALDVADLVPHRYHLEVSSPGVERPLKTPADYTRFVGEKAKLWLTAPSNGQKVVSGRLESFDGGVVVVTETAHGERVHRIPFAEIDHARLVFEFGAAPKPQKNGSHHGAKHAGAQGANGHAKKQSHK